MNIISWKSKTNRRVIESSFAAETHAAMLGHSSGQYLRALLMEIQIGDWVIRENEDVEWDRFMPLVMVTDCRAVFDCVKKDAQSIGDKANALSVAVLRQLCVVGDAPRREEAKLLWVPTRHQCADALTKSGKAQDMADLVASGKATFHGVSQRRLAGIKAGHMQARRDLGQCENGPA